MSRDSSFASAFVSGSTDPLGNNLVRLLVSGAVKVKALTRSAKKASTQPAHFHNRSVRMNAASLALMAGICPDIGYALAANMTAYDHLWAVANYRPGGYNTINL